MELAQAFHEARPETPADPALEAAIGASLEAARAAFPEVCVDDLAFARHLARVLPAGAEARAAIGSLRAAELLLALGCAEGDPAAVRAFDERYLGALPRLVGRLRLDDAAIDELRQALRERLLIGAPRPRIADYAGQGPLEAWVAAAAVRAALNQKRGAAAGERAEKALGEELPEVGLDPELGYLKARYRQDFEAAFEASLARLGDAERALLKLHYLDGLTLEQLARTRNVHRATAARWLADARASLLAGTRAELRQRLGATDREIDSLLGLVRSQLMPRIESFLGKG